MADQGPGIVTPSYVWGHAQCLGGKQAPLLTMEALKSHERPRLSPKLPHAAQEWETWKARQCNIS